MVKPETVSIYQVKKTEKETYKKKRTNWRLKDLKLIDGKDETNVSVDQANNLPKLVCRGHY